jgi:hydrogenase small subunit
MKYHPNLSTAAGTLAISTITSTESVNSGQFILVIEGGIPTAGSGIYCVIGEKDGTSWTMMDAVNELAPKAKWVVAAGTCASFTGVPGAGSNPLAVQSVETLVGSLISQPVINLPGCPAHPLVMVGTLVDLISGTSLTLDSYNRPTKYYGSAIIHQTCTRRGTGEVSSVGVYGCYMKLGCKGRADSLCIDLCPTRKWNNGVNFCMNTDVPCIGCSSPSFPYSNSAPLMTCYLS